MNGKSIFKRILPILIALVVLLVIAVVATVATRDKRVPGFESKSYGNEDFIVYTTSDGTEIKLSRNAVYDTLRGTTSEQSVITDTTVNEIVNMIDADLLAEYVNNVDSQDVYDIIARGIFSATFDKYIKSNEDSFKVEAHKQGKSYRAYLTEELNKKIAEYVKTLKFSYGIVVSEDDFTFKDETNNFLYVKENDTNKLDDDGNPIYQLKVNNESAVYKYYAVEAARYDYAKKVIKEEFEENFSAYIKYLDDLDAYNEYLEKVSDYEEALENWKNTKTGSKPKKSDYYTTKVSKPEEVAEPLSGALGESKIKSLYEEENFIKFWAIIDEFDTQAQAEEALLQYGVVIAENASGEKRWFHYGVLDYSGATDAQKSLIKSYNFTTKGNTNIITDDDYYNLLTTDEELYNTDLAKTSTERIGLVLATKTSPDVRTGAYELTEAEVKDIIVAIYNQNNQADASKQLTASDYDKDAVNQVYDENSKLYYTASELTSKGLYSSGTSSNKFKKFSSESTFAKAETYSNSIVSAGSKYYLYLIVSKDAEVTDWEDYLGGKKYYETEFYASKKVELLEDQATASYTKKAVSKLRYESSLIIFDETLEANYMTNYESDYTKTKKSSKTVIASYKVNGEVKEITVDDVWAKLAIYYGVYSTVDLIQYEWVFLEAKDADGNLFNKYVDYNKYLSGKKLSKCMYDTKEAKDLYDNVSNYVENVKYYLSVGYYESYGYPSTYGWKNFITDYYATFYNVRLETVDDLRLFFINQQIITEYSNYISKVNEETWTKAYLTAAGKKLSEYINTTGIHLLISLPDVKKNEENNSTSNLLDPTRWTDAQLAAAYELYDAVLEVLEVCKEDEISTVLNGIVTAFDEAKLPLTDSSRPNVSYTNETIDGTPIVNSLFTYEYKYYEEGNPVPVKTIDVSKYKAMGFKLTCEDLTVTTGTMVTEFEEAVRQIWNAELPRLVKTPSISETIVYDHSFTAPEYKNYDEDTNTEKKVNVNGTKTYLTTTFGLHVYVNLSSDLSAYFTTNDDGDKVFVEIPDIKYVQMYIYGKNESAKPDYISLSDLYTSYEEAKEDNDTKRLNDTKANIEKAKESLGFTTLSFDEFYELLENYASADSSYVSTQLSTYFTVYTSATEQNSASYSMAFGDYTGSTYYHLVYMEALLSALENGKVSLTDGDAYKNALKSYSEYFIDSYYNSFSTIYFLNGTKDGVEDLLDALKCIRGTTAYDTVCKDAIDALKDFASKAYAALSQDEKTELSEKANAAGVLN